MTTKNDDDRIRRLEQKLEQALEEIGEIKEQLSGYKGFVGGIMWLAGAMLLAVKLLWPWLASLLHIGGK